MTTQYTTILKLALPVEGELSGTWGDVVNDNITQMVEQAVAGKAVVNTWTGNSHTLTTADGTTSESRCAILELTDTGTALTGAGTVVCPTNTKLYIVDNNTARIITVKTSGGTGVAVPVGKTMLVYCDGTNVVEGVTHANSLSLGTSTSTVNAIATATDLGAGGSSDSNLPTQLAVKTYVDGQIAATNELSEVLTAGNVTGANDIDVENAQKVQFRDAAIYLNSSVDGQLDIVADGEVQIATALVDINGNLDVSGTTNISGSVSFTKNAIASVAISGVARSSNTVTVTTSAVHGLSVSDVVNINGVTDTSFNGYFTVTAVSSTTVFTFSQTAANASSSGGSTTEIVYNLNASGTALNQMNGPLNITANSPIDGLEITQSGAGEALSITGGNAIFGDNDKAVFGAGSDLSIYHNGSTSVIEDSGTGNLQIRTSTLAVVNAAGTEVILQGVEDGAVSLYYDAGVRLATSSSGISVTGTATVEGSGTYLASLNNTSQDARIQLSRGGTEFGQVSAGGNLMNLVASGSSTDMRFLTNSAERMRIDASGLVGIGTSSPSSYQANADNLVVASSGETGITIASGTSNLGNIHFADGTSGDDAYRGYIQYNHTSNYMRFATNAVEAMRIDANGVLQSNGYSVVASSARPASGTLRLGNIASTSMLLDYDDQGQTIATVRNQYGTTDATAELSLDSGFITFNTGTSFTEAMRIDASGNLLVGKSNSVYYMQLAGIA